MAGGLTCAANGPGLEVAANGGGFPSNSGLDKPRTANKDEPWAAEVLHLCKGGFVCLLQSSVTVQGGARNEEARNFS